MRPTSGQIPRWAGVAAGLCLAVTIVIGGRLPAEGRSVGARVTMLTQSPQELAVKPAGVRFLDARDLRPGASARGRVRVRNLNTEPLDVAVRARSTERDLDDALHVEMRVAGRRRFTGKLRALRDWSDEFRLGALQRATVRFRVVIPTESEGKSAGRSADLELAWRAREVGS
jgi:hypothetical protein